MRKPTVASRDLPPRRRTPNQKRTASPTLVLDVKRQTDYAFVLQQVKRGLAAPKSPMPTAIKPTLASIKGEAFNDAGWQFEIKWDGYRTLAYTRNGMTDLRSRNNLSLNAKFSPIAGVLNGWPVRAVLDGEVVVLSEEGKSDFAALQNFDGDDAARLRYYVFDLLWLEGRDLRGEPLHVRRHLLKKILPENSPVRYSESIDECGIDFLAAARANGLEGIIAKRSDSIYQDGLRTNDWYKIKLECRHEAVICGYTKQKGSVRLFSSLVLGVPTTDGLRYIGQVGTGVTSRSQRGLFRKMNSLFTPDCPFDTKPATGAPTQWMEPGLVCEVKYTALTTDGLMRHASFQGLREDKTIDDINLNETCVGDAKAKVEATRQKHNSVGQTNSKSSENNAVVFSNLSKIYWPKEGFTKGDVINHYRDMAPYILPYLKNRPQSLHRFPNGVEGESFYQKDIKGALPAWAKTFARISGSDGGKKKYLVCNGEASLLYMANLGCIEMHPWHARVQAPLRPDWCVIDLDPGAISFLKVIEAALVVKTVLDSLGVPSYPKTSGATGLHFYVPLGAKYSYEQSRHFAELVAKLVHEELPRTTSLERSPSKRTDKIYLDYLQNREIQTICAPYSLRPRPDATASAPLHWDEVKAGLKISAFNITSMPDRVKEVGDLFRGVLGKGIDLKAALATLSNT